MRLTGVLPAPPSSLDGVDLYTADGYAGGDPHAAWRLLRERAPVLRQAAPDGTPFWSVTGYRDVAQVLRDTTTFSSEHSTMLSAMHGDIAKGKAIHLTDPPRHGALRGPLVGALSSRVLRERADAIRARVRELVRACVAAGGIDFAKRMSVLPMAVAGDILGIPPERWDEATHWSMASVAPEDPDYLAGTAESTLSQAHVYLMSLFLDLIAGRRRAPTGDLVSLLTQLRLDGRPLTDHEVLVNCYAFLIGSNITTPQVASHLVLVMAGQPALWRAVRADPGLRLTTVEELLRWATPTNHLLRRTSRATVLGGHDLPAGALVCAWVASANRDEEVFADPFVFDPARRPNPHLTFGVGPHRCIGDRVARTGLSILLEELVAEVAAFEVTGEVRHLRSNFLNGVSALPAVLHAAKAA